MMGKSLADLMGEAYALSLDVAYETIAPDGTYLDARELPGEFSELVWGWADGLVHKYYERVSTGCCSLQAQVDFDLGEFVNRVARDVLKMRGLLGQVGEPRRLTFAEMRERGYRGAWAGLPS